MERKRGDSALAGGCGGTAGEKYAVESVVVGYALVLVAAVAESIVASRYLGTQREEV